MDAAVSLAAARIISEGGVIAFRTDTFYGLGADPFNATAVARIRGLKGREENKPILLLLADASVADRFIA
ncbi:MAG TPA: Sua5/YciO/YrdC/YwlC family protein, partial [Pyrinomonadaceae bacterium]|nr:Sua5/YciO/YrdC/YwlC family protein [Pyrinomonadaceae bacterium]